MRPGVPGKHTPSLGKASAVRVLQKCFVAKYQNVVRVPVRRRQRDHTKIRVCLSEKEKRPPLESMALPVYAALGRTVDRRRDTLSRWVNPFSRFTGVWRGGTGPSTKLGAPDCQHSLGRNHEWLVGSSGTPCAMDGVGANKTRYSADHLSILAKGQFIHTT